MYGLETIIAINNRQVETVTDVITDDPSKGVYSKEKFDGSGRLHGWQKLTVKNAVNDMTEIAYYNHGMLVYSRITTPEKIHIRAYKNGLKVKDVVKGRKPEVNPADIIDGIDGLIYQDQEDHAAVLNHYKGTTSFNYGRLV
jgi:hypothetical protein